MKLANKNKEKTYFTLIPLMPGENLRIQEMSLPLFQAHTSDKVDQYALKHKNIIARFGKFPNRNAILGRTSTASKIEFLKSHGCSF